VKCWHFKAIIENKTTSVTTYFKRASCSSEANTLNIKTEFAAVTFDNNQDNKHVVSYVVNLLKCVVTEVLFQ